MVVVGGIEFLKIDVVELPVMLPDDNPFVVHGIRHCKSFKDTWGSRNDTVLYGSEAVLYFHFSQRCSNLYRKLLLVIIFLALLSAE